jgi:hypothetical protein
LLDGPVMAARVDDGFPQQRPVTGPGLVDDGWNQRARGETPMQRLDRNWADLLQELRVVQTGVQLLTGFLLTLPFQARFQELTGTQQAVYLTIVAVSVAATGFLVAPVAVHRILFRRHARHVLVRISHRLAVIGLVLLGAAIAGVVLLIFDVVAGRTLGMIAAAAAMLLLISLWAVLPITLGRHHDDDIADPEA